LWQSLPTVETREGLAEEPNVDNAHNVGEAVRVTVSARVPPALAREIARLADAGDRTVSREVARAIQKHVAGQVPGSLPPLGPDPAERDGNSHLGRQSSSSQLAGSEEVT
jgi:hypothetical protein